MMERMGQVIAGRFELVAPIARGGQGTVWLAEDRRTGRRCAAKVLDQADSASLLRFVREQGVQVDHAHLASPYGWAAEDHEVAIAMPLVAGGSLEGALADWGALGEQLTAALLLQLLDGLAELHGSGWIHRDVKPANVLLDATGTGAPHLRLGDMGLAMRADAPRLTSLGHLHGTPGYVPPEAYRDEAPDPAQDLFAAGVTGLRMLDPGCRPQDAGEVERALGQVEDAELKAVLTGLVAEDPAARIRAAAEAPRLLAGHARPESSGVRPDDGPRLEGTSRLPAGYLTASGETFEVFDQLEGLDEDLGAGPEEVAGPEEDTEDVPPVAETSVITAPGRVEASAPAGAPGASGVPGVAGTAASRPVAPAAEAPAAETPRCGPLPPAGLGARRRRRARADRRPGPPARRRGRGRPRRPRLDRDRHLRALGVRSRRVARARHVLRRADRRLGRAVLGRRGAVVVRGGVHGAEHRVPQPGRPGDPPLRRSSRPDQLRARGAGLHPRRARHRGHRHGREAPDVHLGRGRLQLDRREGLSSSFHT